MIARKCDSYLVKTHPDLKDFLFDAIDKSINCKGRLLHYFPINVKTDSNDNQQLNNATKTPEESVDSWCGIHIDHSLLTGLTSALYINTVSQTPLDSSLPSLSSSGLYIKSRGDSLIQAIIPPDCLAFQLGEAAQIASRGLLVATPHLVRAAKEKDVGRNTFAVFMQVLMS